MKKLLLSSIVLFLFSASIVMFQMSCKKEAKADNPIKTQSDEIKQLGKISYRDKATGDFYLTNYDGTGKQKLNIVLPSGYEASRMHLSPDGKKMFVVSSSANGYVMYSYDIDGGNMKKVVELDDNDNFGIY